MNIVKDDEWALYPNFSKEEMACKHTGLCRVTHKLMSALQAVRNDYGKPIIVTSGYRDISHPAERKKTKIGEHSEGLAVDIHIFGEDVLTILALALKHGVKRIGINQKGDMGQRFIHLGLGDKSSYPLTVWSY